VCEPHGRRGRHNVAGLKAKYGGDIALPDLRHVLTNWKRDASLGIHDRCKARYKKRTNC